MTDQYSPSACQANMPRLAIFDDQEFYLDGTRYYASEAHIRFLLCVASHFHGATIYARVRVSGQRGAFPINAPGVRVVPLPHYENYHAMLTSGVTLLPRIAWKILSTSTHWDAALLSWPTPLAAFFLLPLIFDRSGKRVCIAMRQNLPALVRIRYRGLRRLAALMTIASLNAWLRLFRRKITILANGSEMHAWYARRFPDTRLVRFPVISRCDVDHYDFAEKFARMDPLRLLFVGRLEPEKALPVLLDGLGLLKKSGVRFTCDIIGAGPLERQAREAACRNDVGEEAAFRGFIPFGKELLDYYRQAHVLLITSHSEGLPKVIFEAMACGVIVVAVAAGGIGDVVADRRNGLLLNACEPGNVADALSAIAANPSFAASLSKQAVATMQGQFMEDYALQAARIIAAPAQAA